MRVYLDNCCFNRPFDDQKQLRIRLETEAKLNIQERILLKEIELAWSYILDFENEANPFNQRKLAIRGWAKYASVDIDETREILEEAEKLNQMGFRVKDSLHLACAIVMRCDCFLTTDDELVRKATDMSNIRVTDPVSFVMEGTK